jgi:hypothetical protein
VILEVQVAMRARLGTQSLKDLLAPGA